MDGFVKTVAQAIHVSGKICYNEAIDRASFPVETDAYDPVGAANRITTKNSSHRKDRTL